MQVWFWRDSWKLGKVPENSAEGLRRLHRDRAIL